MRISRRRTKAVSSSSGSPSRLLAASLVCVTVAGCARSAASRQREAEVTGARRVVAVRIGPLVGEHPLYPTVLELTSHLGATETADLRAAKAFLTSDLGRALAPPPSSPERPFPALTRWEAAANADLAARTQEAEQLLDSWPRPELSRTRDRLAGEADDRLRDARNTAALEAVRAEMRAIEKRKGLLAELRQLAASADEAEAARAIDEQVRLWREVAAEAEATRREGDMRLRELGRAHERELAQALAALDAAADEDRQRHKARLSGSGTPVREAVGPAAEAAMTRPEPAPNATETPRAPETKAVSELIAEVERAHRAAWERRRVRLAAARGRLLQRIAQDTRNAVKAIAARNGIEVRLDCMNEPALPDATEELRVLLRNHWAGRPAMRSQEVALATQ